MIAAITAILGFLTSLGPAVVSYFELKENNAQAVRLEELKQRGRREELAGQVDVADAQADIRQADRIYGFASGASGYRFVDALAAIIRPYVTFVFFHFFLLIEAALFIYGVNSGYDLGQLAKLLWDDNTQAIFGAIMGFWFGDRMLKRGQQMAATRAIMAEKK